jgi:LysR family hydrogen peroxide-inducible transcriptional activator
VTLTELRYLVAVAEEQHFGRAAERSFVSQPSLSAAIKHVEDELGVRVFERSKRGVALTDIGKEIVARARRALDRPRASRSWRSRARISCAAFCVSA